MQKFLWLIALLPLSAPALADNAPCFVDWGAGEIDLTEAMCGGYSEIPSAEPAAALPASSRQSSSPTAAATAHTFPAWLIDNNPGNDPQARIVANDPQFGTDFVYGDRWVKNFTDYPWTFDAGNQAEWDYYDCQTGWYGAKDFPFVGTEEPDFWGPGEIDIDVARTCQRLGVPVGF